MHTGYVERSNGMAAREKRSLDPSSSQEGQPDRKRPALASVIVEALKVDSLQKLCSSLEPILRRVVSEEVERALAKLGPAKLNGRVSPKRIEGPDGRNLQLQFRSKLSLPLFTGGKVEGEQGAAIHVVLIDANTGHVVTSGPESSVKLDIVVLEGDFNNEDDEGWSQEEFESHIVREREGKRPLLTGDLQVTLKEGVGTLGELTFTDNSSWIRSRKFRLGLRVASGSCEGFRIREAKTDAFTVKDHRGELYKKHYPPALNDEVWRLEKIGKDGSFHKRLNKAGIYTVEDFLRLVVRDPQKLRHILGSGMSNKMWEVLVEHSKTCVLSGKLYVYYPDEPRNVGVVFNDIYVLSGLIAGGQYHSVDSLSESHKVFVDTLVKKAYENWMHVIEYDGKSLLGFDQSKSSNASQNDLRIHIQDQPNPFDQLSLPNLPIPPSIPAEPPTNPGLTIGGYNDNIVSRYPTQPQNMNLNVSIQLDGASFPAQNQLINSVQQAEPSGSENVLALGPPHSTTLSFPTGGTSNLTSYRGFEDIPEDEIRIRSHEMLENEDMQHLLRVFSMGGHGHGHGHASFNVNENNYTYSAYTPMTPSTFGFDVDRTRPSGKAVVGWLKLKAALRWGIFIRKKAAERRAQIVELDDF
ncbi:Calmodulin-binding protein 60 B [Sesamum angolense]|uniref:Calmodulin-binding protein 60 B n=1 Tax=Sesamum angolense TaxID=2727404 RepID=A0AAE1WTL6_9LAMI|nr:Calmodulin-binding protein 60 B [Sesamum angolense]